MNTFHHGVKYIDRVGRVYSFVRKSGGVTVFEDVNGKPTCRNDKGLYRWDDKQTDEDIINEVSE